MMCLEEGNQTMISFPTFYATWYGKTHLNVCIIFAADNNLSLSVLLLLNLTGGLDKNLGPVSNHADVLNILNRQKIN